MLESRQGGGKGGKGGGRLELKNEILKKRTIRVGKCHGYDRYIRVKILAGCGKKFGGTDNFPKMNTFLQDLQILCLKTA